jgi:multiple sugar transport system ATP-binding protein
MARVVLDRVTKVFRGSHGGTVHAVRDFSLAVEDGELVVLVGPSGSGKTTTLRLISGLEELSAGKISLDGVDVSRVPPKDRDLAMVFQHHALYPHMTVFENLAFGLKLRKLPRGETDRRVDEAAERLGLTSVLHALPRELSGGQRQRVAVGRAMVRRPKVFLFDEPLSQLDPQLRGQMRKEIAKLQEQLGATTIYVTHDQGEAMTLGDRIGVMKEGVLQQVDRPLRVYHQPVNLFVAGFIGSPPMNLLCGTIAAQDGRLLFREQRGNSVAGLSVAVPAAHERLLEPMVGRRVVLGLRSERIQVSTTGSQDAATGAAMVEFVETTGSATWVHLNTGTQTLVALHAAGECARLGEPVRLVLDMVGASYFDPATEQALS